MNNAYEFGMIGLGVMGSNFLLNMADHGFGVVGFDLDAAKTEAFEKSATEGTTVKGVGSLAEMTQLLSKPRKIMMLVPAGKPVDSVIESLLPLLEKGDIIIDGGNSHYTDTLRRVKYCSEKGLHFMGMGVSGGEQGARTGPSIMPGGDEEAYKEASPMLTAVAAKVGNEACVDYMGKDAAGHYVKMVHNGIEYAIMQLISECYDLLYRGAGLSNDELHALFTEWNEGELQSFLVEITAAIFLQKDDKSSARLVDMILDKAGAKGTGKWTSQDAMELGVPIPTIDMAVTMRNISALKAERSAAAKLYQVTPDTLSDKQEVMANVHDALYVGILASYAQGLELLRAASTALNMNISLPKVVNVWRGGCIIRSSMLYLFAKVFAETPDLQNILLNETVAASVKTKLPALRKVIAQAATNGFPVAGLMSVLGYIDAYSTERLPTNLIQAQRDFFGAHTYQRIDSEGSFHTEWNAHDIA